MFLLWLLQLAWVPFELEEIVRSAAPFVLAVNWQDVQDPDMLLLQVSHSTNLLSFHMYQ